MNITLIAGVLGIILIMILFLVFLRIKSKKKKASNSISESIINKKGNKKFSKLEPNIEDENTILEMPNEKNNSVYGEDDTVLINSADNMDGKTDDTVLLMADEKELELLLTVIGTNEPISLDLSTDIIVGRNSDCDLVIEDEKRTISNFHGKFEMKGQEIYYKDLDSKNGSWLNGKEVIDTIKLSSNDVLKIADVEMSVDIK